MEEETINLRLNKISSRQFILSPAVQSGNDRESTSTDFFQYDKKILYLGCLGVGLKVKHHMTENPYTIVGFEKEKISKWHYQEKINSTLELMYKSCHPYMFRLLNNYETEDRIGLIFEPYEGESLDVLIQQGKCDLNTSLKYFVEILLAVKHANFLGLYNVNIRPENILVDECVKITDYGLKMTGKADIPKRPKEVINIGNRNVCIDGYFSPEEVDNILNKKDNVLNSKMDSWSFGVLLYEMLTNFKSPFIINDNQELSDSIINSEIDLTPITDEFCRDLISKLLVKNPNERIDIVDVLNNDLIKTINIEQKDIDLRDNIINPEDDESVEGEDEEDDDENKKDEIIKKLKAENEELKKELSKEKEKNNSQKSIKRPFSEIIANKEEKINKNEDNLELLSDKEDVEDENKNNQNMKNDDINEELFLDEKSSSDEQEYDLENENIYTKYEILKEKYIKKKKKIKIMYKIINTLKEEKNNLIKEHNQKEEQKNLNILNNLEKKNFSKITNLSELSEIINKSLNVFKESENNLQNLMNKLIKISNEEHKPFLEESQKYINEKSKIYFDMVENLKLNENKEDKKAENKEREERTKIEIKNTEISELKKKYELSKQRESFLKEKIKTLEEKNKANIELNKNLEKTINLMFSNYKH